MADLLGSFPIYCKMAYNINIKGEGVCNKDLGREEKGKWGNHYA
jgi:hypothetical protein